MPVLYAIKHVLRSWKLFLALLIGITLASTFFAGIDIKANATARQAIKQELSYVYVDIVVGLFNVDPSQMPSLTKDISDIDLNGISKVEVLSAFSDYTAEGYVKPPSYVRIVGIQNDSGLYDGWLNKPSELGVNETYVLESTDLAKNVTVGGILPINFTIYLPGARPIFATVNLTVKGFAQLDARSEAIARGSYSRQYYQGYSPFVDGGLDTVLVDWQNTMRKLMETRRTMSQGLGQIGTELLIYLNRDAMISPWDITTSISNIRTLQARIQNEVPYSTFRNYLDSILPSFSGKSMSIQFTFSIISLPVFFMAWYMGTTVADVSFNLRRREIGLLSTKGFSRSQIQRIFLTETLMLGLLGGLLGVLFGFLLNPIFTQFSTELLFDPKLISPYTVVATTIFGAVIAFLSTYSSARKASRLSTVYALREYLPANGMRLRRRRLPLLAFTLGAYKLIIFTLGINVTTELTGVAMAGRNFALAILIGLVVVVDLVLNYIGPLLFFWGATKLFIEGSLKFQELTTKFAKFLGDLGALATKNVRRNPARSAAIAFLIALIISYGTQVTAQLASERDYVTRNVYSQVGADLNVYVTTPGEASDISSMILANVSSRIESSTIEYQFTGMMLDGRIGITLKAVQPESWLEAAYYEKDLFTGTSPETAFKNLSADMNTVILEKNLATLLALKVGDSITLFLGGGGARRLVVVGFFGQDTSGQQGTVSQYWSFIPDQLYEQMRDLVVVYNTRILLKLRPGENGAQVAASIRSLGLNVSSVTSFADAYEFYQSDVVTVGSLDAQRLGVFFVVLAASVGTALVSVVSMKERSREATIMSVKGLSYKQLAIMFLTENFAVVTFAVVLGIVVGFIVAYGNIASNNSFMPVASVISRRFVFPADAAITLTSCVALIYASAILPIVIMARSYVTRLERMVRLR